MNIREETVKLYLRKDFLELDAPVVMGVLNVTPDSFSDGGNFLGSDSAIRQAEQMVEDGAAIIDVGGESTRPGARQVSADEELDRVMPVIEKIKDEWEVLVSVDTYKERVARTTVLEGGADLVNDISALGFSDNMADTIAKLEVPVILMHIKGTPEDMQKEPFYKDVIRELKQYFQSRIDFALAKGIKKEKIIIDPGIGFGKRLEDNIEIIKKLETFTEFELPIMIGTSRKSFLGSLGGETIPIEREAETITANIISILNGASIIRVHHVKNAVKSINVLKRLVDL
ncbi:MAG: dihydropteroate synthase [Candidatus Aminicenantes bacterium]|nr:dihydropteroate synthase [Candidatus Aminicenantes bacterium]NIM79583.1 dihydropteroate synthase [Candidatus Aminicenantes bacterium]NIN18892.1 dihydropteroate synthase [Candidatus Aminicenantes bacterium]NIN42802.1 dihydropteroate synthase [Candidatus Aminicenantes bacterium]NIN85529.1 dihydropteroate synthase [Candidatus Aminicenantes bacterium]